MRHMAPLPKWQHVSLVLEETPFTQVRYSLFANKGSGHVLCRLAPPGGYHLNR